MTNLSVALFPEYKKVISHDMIKKRLNLVESIVNYSEGRNLDSNTIDKIKNKLKTRLEGTRLYKGGSSVLFGWSFYFKNLGTIIIKPYYSRELIQLIVHYLTSQDFSKNFNNIEINIDDNNIYQIAIPETIGIAKIETFSRVYPTLIVREIRGDSIQYHSYLIKHISRIARDLALQGIITDPYPSNWILSKINNSNIIYYIDLLSSNQIQDINRRISELINQLE